ncbi:MAG: family oxidoreductase [Propionibacteriaceae bacterium]|jgi:hypothetical protein|nr:family oxidoreductase [Propionibacteriaceae bacterium]
MDALQAEAERLRIAIDAVVPADDFPWASHAGGLQFWSQVDGTERPDWADRVLVVLDLLDRRSGGRFGDLDADARLAVIESLLDDPDNVWFLSPPGGSDRAARAGGQAGAAPPAAETQRVVRLCRR